ncbi:uncharacterized protein N7483_007588 [Penicillium malachiteum]|uniref:uncharacterized protein n=1 Tax=Penicillium malachiteum TaxID=1324776 RepID=UPI0025477AA0|nr:uncharacterized protein N7483_007588 [Penicillium malachiteum]KAJ5726231.1 hypothetical protein N7483_007588 [Penicillium malachiteum]
MDQPDLARESVEFEKQYLLDEEGIDRKRQPQNSSRYHLYALYTTNGLLLFIVLMLLAQMRHQCAADPSLGVYCKSTTCKFLCYQLLQG